MRHDRLSWLAVAVTLASPLAFAGKAHQHGVAQLDIAYEAGKLTVALDSPLDNLLGFERAPRTDAERQAANAAVARLKDGAALFSIDPAAQCSLGKTELESAPLKLGPPGAKGADGHADMAASWEFVCKGAPSAWIDVGLIDAFRRLSTLEVQAVGGKAQGKSTLKRPAKRLVLPR